MPLVSLELTHPKEIEFPFNLPLIKNLKKLNLKSPVIFFVGENGSGKSTLLEGIATVCNLPVVGSENIDKDETLSDIRNFANNLHLSWTIKSTRGFFLRAEDFFGFIKKIKSLRKELNGDKKEYEQGFSGYGQQLAVGLAMGQLHGLEKRYGDLGKISHGEGYLKLFQERLVPGGLYLLDEPEAALSPLRQLSLISLIKSMIKNNCQFIIATHSPILMAFSDAIIYEFGNETISQVKYQDVEHVVLVKDYLNNPQEYLNRL